MANWSSLKPIKIMIILFAMTIPECPKEEFSERISPIKLKKKTKVDSIKTG
jgi:hypothetical protein